MLRLVLLILILKVEICSYEFLAHYQGRRVQSPKVVHVGAVDYLFSTGEDGLKVRNLTTGIDSIVNCTPTQIPDSPVTGCISTGIAAENASVLFFPSESELNNPVRFFGISPMNGSSYNMLSEFEYNPDTNNYHLINWFSGINESANTNFYALHISSNGQFAYVSFGSSVDHSTRFSVFQIKDSQGLKDVSHLGDVSQFTNSNAFRVDQIYYASLGEESRFIVHTWGNGEIFSLQIPGGENNPGELGSSTVEQISTNSTDPVGSIVLKDSHLSEDFAHIIGPVLIRTDYRDLGLYYQTFVSYTALDVISWSSPIQVQNMWNHAPIGRSLGNLAMDRLGNLFHATNTRYLIELRIQESPAALSSVSFQTRRVYPPQEFKPVSDVTVQLHEGSQSKITAANGQALFQNVAIGNYEPLASKPGTLIRTNPHQILVSSIENHEVELEVLDWEQMDQCLEDNQSSESLLSSLARVRVRLDGAPYTQGIKYKIHHENEFKDAVYVPSPDEHSLGALYIAAIPTASSAIFSTELFNSQGQIQTHGPVLSGEESTWLLGTQSHQIRVHVNDRLSSDSFSINSQTSTTGEYTYHLSQGSYVLNYHDVAGDIYYPFTINEEGRIEGAANLGFVIQGQEIFIQGVEMEVYTAWNLKFSGLRITRNSAVIFSADRNIPVTKIQLMPAPSYELQVQINESGSQVQESFDVVTFNGSDAYLTGNALPGAFFAQSGNSQRKRYSVYGYTHYFKVNSALRGFRAELFHQGEPYNSPIIQSTTRFRVLPSDQPYQVRYSVGDQSLEASYLVVEQGRIQALEGFHMGLFIDAHRRINFHGIRVRIRFDSNVQDRRFRVRVNDEVVSADWMNSNSTIYLLPFINHHFEFFPSDDEMETAEFVLHKNGYVDGLGNLQPGFEGRTRRIQIHATPAL